MQIHLNAKKVSIVSFEPWHIKRALKLSWLIVCYVTFVDNFELFKWKNYDGFFSDKNNIDWVLNFENNALCNTLNRLRLFIIRI